VVLLSWLSSLLLSSLNFNAYSIFDFQEVHPSQRGNVQHPYSKYFLAISMSNQLLMEVSLNGKIATMIVALEAYYTHFKSNKIKIENLKT